MTTNLNTTPQLIGLAAAGAAALGLSLSDGLLQPMGRLATLRKARRATSTTAPVIEETPEHRAALPHVAAPAPTAAPERKAAPTAGLFDMFGGEDAEEDPIIHP